MLQKGPQQKNSLAIDVAFTASARIAWKCILDRVKTVKQAPIRILAPAYVGQTDREGSGVLDPIRETQSKVSFYPLTNRLIPNQTAITQAIEEQEIDVLLIIHYFGFVHADMGYLKKLCSYHGVTLVEDCAHCCFGPDSEHGGMGDFSFYSLHKFFPTQSGGVLRTNIAHAPTFEFARQSRCEMSVLEQVLRTDINAVARKRRDNYQILEQALSRQSDISLFWSLDNQTIPHNFPIYVKNGQREKLYFHLLQRDLPTMALYYRLVDELDDRLFPDSFDTANGILNLPVHQDTSECELMGLVKEIEVFFES